MVGRRTSYRVGTCRDQISRFLQNSEGVLEGYLKNQHGFKLISCLSWFAKTLEV